MFKTPALGLRLFSALLALLAFVPIAAVQLSAGSATTVVLTLVWAVWLQLTSPSPILRRVVWAAVILAFLQAVMSELMVLWELPLASAIVHDIMQQLYFAWMVSVAVLLQEPPTEAKLFPCGDKRLLRLTLLTTIFVVWQLIAGSIYRYTGLALHAHFLGALLVLVHAPLVFRRVFTMYRHERWVYSLSIALLALVLAQILLGVLTWRTTSVWIALTHIGVGALILASALALTVLAARRLPPLAPVSEA